MKLLKLVSTLKMKLLFTILFLFVTIISNAQLSDVITGLNGPRGMFIDGSNLYFGEDLAHRISKFNTSENTPNVTEVLSGLGQYSPYDIQIEGIDLYYVDRGANKIMRVYTPVVSSTPNVFYSGISDPSSILIIGDELYISQANPGKISKIDISVLVPVLVEVVSGLDNPIRMASKGFDLYIAEYSSGEISKINITSSSPVPTVIASGLDTPYDLEFHGDYLFFSEFNGNKISKINVEEDPMIVEEVTSEVDAPTDLVFLDDDLYISEFGANKISVYRDIVNDVTVVPESDKKIKVYPNPSSDYITIQYCQPNSKLLITDMEGRIWKNSIINEGEWIDVKDLAVGTYSLSLEGHCNMLFFKQ